ncbi:MAG: peptidoglycan DD-metalloendopeptidase family protein [Desulfovibrionaceae bacterium]
MSPTSSMDMAQAMSSLDQQNDVRRKVELDTLRKRLEVGKSDEKKLREACEGFESIFIQKMWKQMRANVPKEGYLHSKEEDYYLSMFDDEMSKKMASAGGMGLGDMLYGQLKQQLASASRATSPAAVPDPLPLKPLDQGAHRVASQAAHDTVSPGAAPAPAAFKDSLDSLYAPLAQAGREGEATAVATNGAAGTSADAMTDAANLAAHVTAALNTRAAGVANAADAAPGGSATPPLVANAFASQGSAQASGQDGVLDAEQVMAQVNDLERRIELRQGVSAGEGGPVPVEQGAVYGRMRGEMNLTPMEWPVEGDISSDFGWRRDPFTGRHAFHAGVDIVADEGSPVQACWKGTVTFAGERGGYGNLVVVDHGDGWESWYGHNSELDVRVGDTVAAGSKIAAVGSSGRSTGAHLHFELRQGEQAWDPVMIQNRLQSGLSIGSPARREG